MSLFLAYLKVDAADVARSLVAVAQIVHIAQILKLIIHSRDDGVNAISNQSDLLVEFSVSSQRINWDVNEFYEMGLSTRILLEEPTSRNKPFCLASAMSRQSYSTNLIKMLETMALRPFLRFAQDVWTSLIW